MRADRSPRQWPPRRAGFTIIELMLVIAVAGVLALVAYPSFIESVRKGRRAEAVAALAQVQQSQERWRSNNAAYAGNVAALNLPATTSSGLYNISIDPATATATCYIATATAVAGKSQSQDTQCTVMRVHMNGATIQYGGCAGCAVPACNAALTDPDRCWSR